MRYLQNRLMTVNNGICSRKGATICAHVQYKYVGHQEETKNHFSVSERNLDIIYIVYSIRFGIHF